MRTHRKATVFLVLVFSIGASVQPTDERELRMRRVEDVFRRGEADELRALGQECEKTLQAIDRSALDLRYDLAHVLWRRQLLLIDVPGAAGERTALLTQARQQIDAVLAERPKDIEAAVLLSAVLASQADAGFFASVRYGREAHRLASGNVERAPENPRARLQLGILLLHTPSAFGGGPDAALEHLERAAASFRAVDTARWPHSGATDAVAWLGQALAEAGRKDEARAVYRGALERWPDAQSISSELLPDLDSAAP